MKRIALLALLGLTSTAGAATAADTWVIVKSPNFTVVSNAGDHRASDVARQYEQIRAAVEQLCPWARVQLNRPVTIIAVKDEASLKALAPAFWEKPDRAKPGSVFTSGGDRHYIALRTDLVGNEAEGLPFYSSSYASYTALTLDFSFARGLPLWMVTGMSAVMSNARVDNDQIEYGRPIALYVKRFQLEPHLRLVDLDAVTRESPYYKDEVTRPRYTAQCWALMHFLLFADAGVGGGRANELARLMMAGVRPLAAIAQVYGSTDALQSSYVSYVRTGFFRFGRVNANAGIPKSFPAAPLAAPDAALVRGGFYVATGHLDEARRMIAEARRTQPESRPAYELEGMIADRERQPDAAAAAYTKAAELHSDNFYVNYRLASLTWRPDSPAATLDQVQKLAGRAVELNEAYGPAYTLLANALTALNKPDNAFPLAERAIELEPNQVAPHLAAARALWKLSRREEAMQAARAALPLAHDDTQRREAQALLDSFARNSGGSH